MDETSQARTTEDPGRSSRRISATMAALVGTALGIVGSIATTTIGAHYTAKEHADDRAEARAKERREALTMTYAKAIRVVLAYRDQTVHWDASKTAPIADPNLQNESLEVDSLLTLTGSTSAVQAFEELVYKARMMGPASREQSAVGNRDRDVVGIMSACRRLTDEARKDLESIR